LPRPFSEGRGGWEGRGWRGGEGKGGCGEGGGRDGGEGEMEIR
jgi:hypothetical protein